jgi:hypothetical protein
MNDFVLVAVVKGHQDLLEDGGGVFFGEVAGLGDAFEELPSAAVPRPRAGHEYSITRYMFLSSSNHSNSFTMLGWSYNRPSSYHRSQNIHLALEARDVLDLRLRNYLHRPLLPRNLVQRLPHHPEVPTPQRLHIPTSLHLRLKRVRVVDVVLLCDEGFLENFDLSLLFHLFRETF